MRQNKSIKIFINYVAGPVLFLWLSFIIYRQISRQPQLEASWLRIQESFQSYRLLYFLGAVALIPLNWGLEARKWQVSLAGISRVSFAQAYKAILSGASFSLATPNRMGEYVGRMLHLPGGSRLQSIAVTLVGSISQLLITCYAGVAGLVFLKEPLLRSGLVSAVGYQLVLPGCGGLAIFLTLLYFKTGALGRLLGRWLRNSSYGYVVQAVQTFEVQLLLHLLLLSFLRYTVFVAQYFLLYAFFDVYVPAGILWHLLSLIFLALAVIPSVALAEVGLRGEVSLLLVGLFSANSLGIGFTAVTIWFLNLVVPAAAGSVFLFGVHLFHRQNETA